MEYTLDIHFDIPAKAVVFESSQGYNSKIDLTSSPTVADFYSSFILELNKLDLEPKFVSKPLDMVIDKPFNEITEYHHYDWDSIKEFWQAMTWTRDVFQEHSGKFYVKTCPVHIYWHSLDIAVTRFSGNKLPADPEKKGRHFERDTYSHEQISAGFWAGDPKTPMPMFYCYTFPSPKGLDQEPLKPSQAQWVDANGSPMATLSYEAVRNSDNPRATLLDFLESSYQAGAKKQGWDMANLTTPSLDEI